MDPIKSQLLRELTTDEALKLSKQNSRIVPAFTAQKLEDNARKHWDQFYKRNKTNFFKDRHWTTREFNELVGDSLIKKSFLEVGCGVGNLIFPLMQENLELQIFACDFSHRAVEFVKENSLYNSDRITVFQADIISDSFPKLVHSYTRGIDIVTLVFVLSAIHPNNFEKCLKNIIECMNPNGILLFRDYGLHDMAQIRFKPGNKIDENLYMRQDGTRSYFFTLEKVREIFINSGYTEVDCYYVHNRTVNVKESVDVPRTYIQAKFKKINDF